MMNQVLVEGILWMLLVAAVILLALVRTRHDMEALKLTRAGLSAENPAHLRVRHVIHAEDGAGIVLTVLTVTALIYTGIFAFILALKVLPVH
jgi:hypothetical protein